ncbi:failed axon connections homolog [Aplysia californica]|uniref:Failed axon connections homolog n=1 Tax=Aplysia californica TaxID=6500 RepID=A0ABM1A3E7_APLCA|nr:failed axon connections homolog [Aplysia californica]
MKRKHQDDIIFSPRYKQRIACSISRKRKQDVLVPADTVCLFQIGRGPWAPSLSPFPLKLETFLRMAKIQYMNDHSHRMSSKGKTPWMTFNGQPIADSQFCVEHLKTYFDLDLDKGLSKEQCAVARAMRELTEENLYWTMCYESFIKRPQSLDILLKGVFSSFAIFMFKLLVGVVVRIELWGHGMGRHSDEEIWSIAQRDLQALSDTLVGKAFLMGDKPSEVDCAVFGMLSMVVWQMKGSRHETFVYESLPNLVEYCHRMRDRFWPDWQQQCIGDHYVDDSHKLYSFTPENGCTSSH